MHMLPQTLTPLSPLILTLTRTGISSTPQVPLLFGRFTGASTHRCRRTTVSIMSPKCYFRTAVRRTHGHMSSKPNRVTIALLRRERNRLSSGGWSVRLCAIHDENGQGHCLLPFHQHARHTYICEASLRRSIHRLLRGQPTLAKSRPAPPQEHDLNGAQVLRTGGKGNPP